VRPAGRTEAPKYQVMPVLHSCEQERAPGAVYVESDPNTSRPITASASWARQKRSPLSSSP